MNKQERRAFVKKHMLLIYEEIMLVEAYTVSMQYGRFD